MAPAVDLCTHLAHLDDELRIRLLPVDVSFWSDRVNQPELQAGRGASIFSYEAGPWGEWERHPLGDELVVLLRGSVDVLLEDETGTEVTKLSTPGFAFVVPQMRWHSTNVHEPSSLFFVTPTSAVTEHKPRAPLAEKTERWVHRATKYFAFGWWQMMALVVCSGWYW